MPIIYKQINENKKLLPVGFASENELQTLLAESPGLLMDFALSAIRSKSLPAGNPVLPFIGTQFKKAVYPGNTTNDSYVFFGHNYTSLVKRNGLGNIYF
ncbi:hypothetical protein [Desulfolucanica intricata]|uniref:hypothetical protein n=1 Tax=Desulfolucanica intricata TaxID=1285191 RepID=UPI0008336B15|nr:hypothetical protein [Desulfolucanica intricata]